MKKRIAFAVLGAVAIIAGAHNMAVAQEEGVAQSADAVIAASGGKSVESAAQVSAAPQAEAPKVEEKLSEEQLARKLELAKKMHEIRPAARQIDDAIRSVSMRLPEAEREPFVTSMSSSLNYNAIERISIDAMVDVFTLPELEAMVEYYSKPEAISAGDKMVDWAKIVQPEIARLIDRSLMRTRFGQ